MPNSPEEPQYSPEDDLRDELIGHNPHHLKRPLFDKDNKSGGEVNHENRSAERESLEDAL